MVTDRRERRWADFEMNGIPDTQRPQGRKYLIATRGHRCEICGLTKWQGQPAPLVFDHIDGNAENGALGNVRMICRNCDGQLPTFCSKNRGNGTRGKVPHN